MNSETESQRKILIKMVKQIDLSKLSDSKLRKIINIIIQEEQKPVVTTKSDNIEIIMENVTERHKILLIIKKKLIIKKLLRLSP